MFGHVPHWLRRWTGSSQRAAPKGGWYDRWARYQKCHIKFFFALYIRLQKIRNRSKSGYVRVQGPFICSSITWDDLGRECSANRRHCLVNIFRSGDIRVNFHRPEIFHTSNGCNSCPIFCSKTSARLKPDRWLQKGSFALICQTHSRNACHAGFSNAAFTGIKQILRGHCALSFNAASTSDRVDNCRIL